jgi:hypothetical protein
MLKIYMIDKREDGEMSIVWVILLYKRISFFKDIDI